MWKIGSLVITSSALKYLGVLKFNPKHQNMDNFHLNPFWKMIFYLCFTPWHSRVIAPVNFKKNQKFFLLLLINKLGIII